MRIFIEGQKITCTKKGNTYTIVDYFLKRPGGKQIKLLIEQALEEGLKVKMWEGVMRGRPNEVWIRSVAFSVTSGGKFGLAFTILPAGPPKGVRRSRRRDVLDFV